jgi:hypothetical protein
MANDIFEQIFFNGGLDSDSDEKFIQNGDYLDALNLVKVEDGEGGIVVNIKGNESVYEGSNLGEELCGWTFYDKNESIILFLWYKRATAPKTAAKIVEYNPQTGNVGILIDESASPVDLGFSEPSATNYFIKADMLGDWLAWTDNVNEPRMVNIQDIKDNNPTLTDDYVNLIKAPPLLAPEFYFGRDADVQNNKVIKTFFQFRSQYILDDYRRTVWSPSSALAVNDAAVLEPSLYNESQSDNFIYIQFNSGDANVKYINIGSRNSDFGNWFQITQVDKLNPELVYSKSGDTYSLMTTALSDDTLYYYKFFNDSEYFALNSFEVNLPYDNVPEASETLSFIGENRVAL